MGEKVIGLALEDAAEGEYLEVEIGAGDDGAALFRRLRPAESETADFLVRVTGKETLVVSGVARIVHEERGVFFLRSAEPGTAADPVEVGSAGFVSWDGLIGYARLEDEIDEDVEAAEDRAGPMTAPEAEVEPWDGDVLNKFGVAASDGRVSLARVLIEAHSSISGLEAMILGAWLGVIGEAVAVAPSFDSVVAAVRV